MQEPADEKRLAVEILPVNTAGQVEQVRLLFEEYWNSLGFTPCFQGFAKEVAALPGKYSPPGGRLAIALIADKPAGCAALRRLDEHRCEAKRLYVRPQFRYHGVGRMLLQWLIAEARGAGYGEMLCDTMPVMERAIGMYEHAGFERTGPYTDSPTPGAIFLRLDLSSQKVNPRLSSS